MSLDLNQVKEAVNALYVYLKSQNKDDAKVSMFDDEQFITLNVSLKKTPENSRTKPIMVPIKHSLYAESEMCLFTKDPQQEYKDKIDKDPVPGLTKVIGITQLRKNFHQYQDRRQLLSGFDLFLADARIIPLLPPLLGNKFFEKKKQPVPVNLTVENVSNLIKRARDSTYFFLNGPCCSVKIARTSFSKEETIDNIFEAIDSIVSRIPQKWKNVQSVFIKSSDSIALPIFNSLPGDVRFTSALPEEKKTNQKKASKKGTQKGNKKQKVSHSNEKENKPAGKASQSQKGNGTQKGSKKQGESVKKEIKEEKKQSPAQPSKKASVKAEPKKIKEEPKVKAEPKTEKPTAKKAGSQKKGSVKQTVNKKRKAAD